MHIEVVSTQGTGFIEVAVVHKDKRINWATMPYSKIRVADQQRVFQEINDYWKWLGVEAQDKIFHCYVKIREIIDMSMDPMRSSIGISHYVNEMYKSMPMESFRYWLCTIGNLFIPLDTEEVITEDSRYNRLDQTYLKHDYINLASMALALRPMIPVWGEFLDQCTTQELHKEEEVIALINGTEIVNWPIDEKSIDGTPVETAYDKLTSYVRFCVENEATTLSTLWRGMSSIEIADILQSRVMVRRLTIVLLNDPSSHSIVSNTFRYIKTNINPADRSTADRVNEKRPDNSGSDEDDKTSFIESNKNKQRVPPGDIAAFNVDALDYKLLINKVDPTVPEDKIKACLDYIPVISNKEIHPHQELIAQCVMQKAFPPKAFYHVNKLAVNHLLAMTQAILWHWGFEHIAVFMQVELFYNGDTGVSSQPRNSTRIQNRFKDEMDRLFPFHKPQRTTGSGVPTPPVNMAGISIQTIHASIRASNWVYHGPEELFVAAEQVSASKVLVIPPQIKSMLTELIIKIGQENQ